MAHSLKIKGVDTGFSQASNSHFIDVEVEVFDGEEFVGIRKFGFPLETTQEEIVESLGKVKEALDGDKEIAAASAALNAGLANAEEVKQGLTDTQI